jgi:methionyl-tRNA formyltransferase
MRVLFMGSSALAIPPLDGILTSHEVPLVIAQPDRPSGRGLEVTSPPVVLYARERGIPTYQPSSIRVAEAINRIEALHPDVIVVVAYGKILPREIIKIPPLGCVNLHFSLLPKYRGAAPVNWAIVNGEEKTGVTTILISEELDAGDILMQESVDIYEDDTSITLGERLAKIGKSILLSTLEGLLNKTIVPRKQDSSQATHAPILRKEDGLIDWRRRAKDIRNLVRGMQPWPSAYTYWKGRQIKIFDVDVEEQSLCASPGEIVCVDDAIRVAAGDGIVVINELQMEGKKRMQASQFLRGARIKVGEVFGG